MSSKVDFDGMAGAVKSDYSYDGFWNLKESSASCSNALTQRSQFSYDPFGRYVVHKTVAPGIGIEQSEAYTIEPGWGKTLSITTSDCLTSNYQYDGFGKLTQSTSPDANICNYAYSLVNDVSFMYKITSQYAGGLPHEYNYYDRFNRIFKTEKSAPDIAGGNLHTTLTYYDDRGNIRSMSNSFFPNSKMPRYTDYAYDIYNRRVVTSNYTGNITTNYMQLGNGTIRVNTTNTANQNSGKVIDAAEGIVESSDEGGNINFEIESWGNQTSVLANGEMLMQMTYDDYGRKATISERNSGLTGNKIFFRRL